MRYRTKGLLTFRGQSRMRSKLWHSNLHSLVKRHRRSLIPHLCSCRATSRWLTLVIWLSTILFFCYVQRKQSVILHHNGRVINGKVIYSTPEGVPYDIAVIVSEPIVGIIPCRMSDGCVIIAGRINIIWSVLALG